MNSTPLCKHLRTKKMLIPALAHEAFSSPPEEFGHSCHCWCNRTLAETGPDDQPVGPQTCAPERRCFEE